LLTLEQQEWMNIKFNILTAKPKKRIDCPKGKCRAMVFDIVTNSRFEIFILGAIVANMFVFGIVHNRMSSTYQIIISNLILFSFIFSAICNILFMLIFTVEALMKIFAMGN